MKLLKNFAAFLSASIVILLLLVSVIRASHRYSHVLPKCCGLKVNPYQRNGPLVSGERMECQTNGAEVVVLPNELFPSVPNAFGDVEVELQYLTHDLFCKEGRDEPIVVDFKENKWETVRYGGNKSVYKDFAFTEDNFLGPDGKIYTSKDFCVVNVVNMTSIDVETCSQSCSASRPCIKRCCGGHNSILQSTPSQSPDTQALCSIPTLDGIFWTPSASRIVEKVNVTPDFLQQTKPDIPVGNCKLLQVHSHLLEKGTVNILHDGSLRLNYLFKKELIPTENYCIDGVFHNNLSRTDENSCHASSDRTEEETVVAYVCSPIPRKMAALDSSVASSPVAVLPKCSCSQIPEQEFQLPSEFFWDLSNLTQTVSVTFETSSGLNCPDGYEDSSVEFLFEPPNILGDTGKYSEVSFMNGSLLEFNGFRFQKNEFCIRSVSSNTINLKTCKQACSAKRPCLNRCCGMKTHVSLASAIENVFDLRCEKSDSPDNEWNPLFYNSVYDRDPISPDSVHPIIRHRKPNQTTCRLFSLNRNENHKNLLAKPYKLLDTGELMEKIKRRTWVPMAREDYCLEPFMRQKNNGTLEFSGYPDDLIIWKCFDTSTPAEPHGYEGTMPELLASLYFISSVFYLGIAVVYILRKDKELVFRWSIVCLSLNMTVTFIHFGYTRIASYFHTTGDPNEYFTVCAIIGMFGNFCYLSGFSWITVLCFDIWLTIRSMSPRKKSVKRLMGYMVFAFSLPATIVAIGIVLDLVYRNDLFSDVIFPDYGKGRCLFEPVDAALPFLYGPLAVLTAINVVLLLITAVQLLRARNGINHSNRNSHESYKTTVLMYFKLFLLIGILWIMQFIGWIFTDQPLPTWAIVTVEFGTLVQPVVAFVLLVWNKESRKYFGIQYNCCKFCLK